MIREVSRGTTIRCAPLTRSMQWILEPNGLVWGPLDFELLWNGLRICEEMR